LQIKKVSLNLISSLLNQYFPIAVRSNIKTIQDIWDENSKQFIDCDLLYSQLIDRRNCISEYSKIKKIQHYVKILIVKE
jgi:hypothetical protein